MWNLLNSLFEYHLANPDSRSFWFGKDLPKDFGQKHKAVADLIYMAEIAWNVHVIDMEYSQGNAHAAMTLDHDARKTMEGIADGIISDYGYHPLALINPWTRKLDKIREELCPWTACLLNQNERIEEYLKKIDNS